MKPLFNQLKKNHYSANYSSPEYLSAGELYAEIGYDINILTNENIGYSNTCAVRMSLALIKSGIQFQGRLRIKKGIYKGRTIEAGAKLLADQLQKPSVFGKAKIFPNPTEAENWIKNKKGTIFFNKITSYNGGHIDLIEPENAALICHSHCYFNCKEVWFWEMN